MDGKKLLSYNDNTRMVSEAKYKSIHGEGLKYFEDYQ